MSGSLQLLSNEARQQNCDMTRLSIPQAARWQAKPEMLEWHFTLEHLLYVYDTKEAARECATYSIVMVHKQCRILHGLCTSSSSRGICIS